MTSGGGVIYTCCTLEGFGTSIVEQTKNEIIWGKEGIKDLPNIH